MQSKFHSQAVHFIAMLAIVLSLLGSVFASQSLAQSDSETDSTVQRWEAPTTGVARPGPADLSTVDLTALGDLPVTMQIEKAGVDAQVEQRDIIDGQMQDPSGPWVVSWYKESKQLGQKGNAVFAGHLDYWDVGEAVFYNVGDLEKKDEIIITGKSGEQFVYAVDWVKNFTVADLTTEEIQDIVVGDADAETVTLITCGGPFDYSSGEYLQRTIIRAHRVDREVS